VNIITEIIDVKDIYLFKDAIISALDSLEQTNVLERMWERRLSVIGDIPPELLRCD
jgi:hypothetical protein